jgi:hypothetical protein
MQIKLKISGIALTDLTILSNLRLFFGSSFGSTLSCTGAAA